MLPTSDWRTLDNEARSQKAQQVDVRQELQCVVVGPSVVGQGGEVEEALDARQVCAHRPRTASVLQAAACAQVTTEVVPIPGSTAVSIFILFDLLNTKKAKLAMKIESVEKKLISLHLLAVVAGSKAGSSWGG